MMEKGRGERKGVGVGTLYKGSKEKVRRERVEGKDRWRRLKVEEEKRK